jgi:hypothetical protein
MKIIRLTFVKKSLFAALAIAVISPLAQADYDCRGRERKLTDAEKDRNTRATAAMRAALLPPPVGWVMSAPSVRTPSETLCADFKNDPITFGASVTYVRRPTLEDRRTAEQTSVAIKKELDALRALPPDLQLKIDALNADASALRKEAREAERAGNRDLAKSKYAASEEIGKQIRKLRDDHATAVRPQEMQTIKKYETVEKLKRGYSYSVSLVGNDVIRANESGVERIQFGTNAKTNQSTDRIVRITATFRHDSNGTPEEAQIVKGLIDKSKLQALVSGTLPPLEESQAAITKQDETIAALRAQESGLDKTAWEERNGGTSSVSQSTTPKATQTTSTATPSATETPPSSSPSEVASATPPAAAKPANDAANQTKEVVNTVNKLRGLFGK